MPSLSVLAVVALLCVGAFTLGQHHPRELEKAESPCVISWDENDGTSTLCVLTEKAAHAQHTIYRQR